MSQILSQDEVEALMSEISEGGIKEETPSSTTDKYQPYDFTQKKPLLRGNSISFLDMMFHKFAQSMTNQFSPQFNDVFNAKFFSNELISHTEMINLKLPKFLYAAVYESVKQGCLALWAIDNELVYNLLDTYFGGEVSTKPIKDKGLTMIEASIGRKFITETVDIFSAEWDHVYPLTLKFKDEVLDPKFILIAPKDEIMLFTMWKIQYGQIKGYIYFALPYWIMDDLDRHVSHISRTAGVSRRINKVIYEHLLEMDVRIKAELCNVDVMLKNLMEWKKGDFIPIPEIKDDNIKVYLEDAVKYRAKAGVTNGVKSVQIQELRTRDGG